MSRSWTVLAHYGLRGFLALLGMLLLLRGIR